MYNKKQLKLLPLSHECFPIAQRPGSILRDAPATAATLLLVQLLRRRRRRFLVLAIIFVFLLDRVVSVVVLPIITGWRRSSIMMAGLYVPLAHGTAHVVVVVVVDR